jgi:hypothetical protein
MTAAARPNLEDVTASCNYGRHEGNCFPQSEGRCGQDLLGRSHCSGSLRNWSRSRPNRHGPSEIRDGVG